MSQSAFLGFLILATAVWQINSLKQQEAESVPSQTPEQAVLRACGCDELNRCHDEQLRKEQEALATCRQECGAKIFLKPTLQKVVQCYEEYEHAKSDGNARRQKCMDDMGNRRCVSTDAHTPPQTLVINTTEYLHSGTKRRDNPKISYPDSVTSLNSCIKTCVKSHGATQSNPEGTPGKPGKATKDAEKKQKYGKHYDLCASQLGCQLSPVDKKLEKQAKQLCKFQPGPHEDIESKFCTCLENSLGQNLYCNEQLSSTETCSSPGSGCSGSQKVDSKPHK